MANNNLLYNAAAAGCAGGVSERWLSSEVSADYAPLTQKIALFASAVDSAIPAGTVSDSDAKLVQALSLGVLSDRYLSADVQASQLAAIGRAVGAAFAIMKTIMLPVNGDVVPASPVYVADYMPAAGNDLRAAMIAAQAANTGDGITFVMPNGTYSWTPGTTFQPRNNTIWSAYGCTIELNMNGVASGQQFIFLRIDVAVGTHPDKIQFWGGTYRILNVLTSFFSAAIQLDGSSNCVIKDATAECTFDAAATQGRIRWGFNLLGGDQTVDPTQGRNNRFENCTLDFAQIQGCASGRSASNVTVTNTLVRNANDLAISVVSTGATQSLQNVSILNTECVNIGGNGVILAGTDGAGTGFGCGVIRNFNIDGVYLTGERSTPDLDFTYSTTVSMNGGLVTENVNITNVGTSLSPNASLQPKSILIQSQTDEVSWNGLTVSNFDLGVVSTNDPLEALFISGANIKGLNITNGNVRGLRGIRIVDCDVVTIDNVSTQNGTLLFIASSRNLTGGININNVNLNRSTGFNAPLQFTSTNGRTIAPVTVSNAVLNGLGAGVNTSLAGGSMRMFLSGIDNVSGTNPSTETLTGIIRAVNLDGMAVITTVQVAVPAAAVGVVAYVDVAMTGTRLADLAVGESIVVNPQADLVAAGAGGGIVSARVSATGTVRIGYSGVGAGNVNHSFARAA